jgi:protein gp37
MSGPGQWGEGFAAAPRRHSETGAATTGVRGKWTGKVELIPSKLDEPLHWRKPQRVFVNSMSDLFHEALPNEAIERVLAVMALAPQHTFQILTKRPERMQQWFASGVPGMETREEDVARAAEHIGSIVWDSRGSERHLYPPGAGDVTNRRRWPGWPLPNVWLGVSVEGQATADERIPLLLQTPAAVRFVSYEPALGPVDFRRWLNIYGHVGAPCCLEAEGYHRFTSGRPALDWIIVGGESGPGSRRFDVGWARDVVEACRQAGVAVFYKQGGSSNRCEHSSKGGCQECMPAALRVREFPTRHRTE